MSGGLAAAFAASCQENPVQRQNCQFAVKSTAAIRAGFEIILIYFVSLTASDYTSEGAVCSKGKTIFLKMGRIRLERMTSSL